MDGLPHPTRSASDTPNREWDDTIELERISAWIRSRACNHCTTGDLHACRNPAASMEALANADAIDEIVRRTRRGQHDERLSGDSLFEQVSTIERTVDTALRLRMASVAQEMHALCISRLAEIRSRAMSSLVRDGWTYQAVAALTGISRARVEQIVKRHHGVA